MKIQDVLMRKGNNRPQITRKSLKRVNRGRLVITRPANYKK